MLARLAADAVLVLHLAFIAFAVLGALLAFRWRWIPLIQLPAAAWAVFVEATGRVCPLTDLENHFLTLAGLSGYPESFIERYLLPIIYPSGLTPQVQFILASIVLGINGLVYALLLRRRLRRRRRSG